MKLELQLRRENARSRSNSACVTQRYSVSSQPSIIIITCTFFHAACGIDLQARLLCRWGKLRAHEATRELAKHNIGVLAATARQSTDERVWTARSITADDKRYWAREHCAAG